MSEYDRVVFTPYFDVEDINKAYPNSAYVDEQEAKEICPNPTGFGIARKARVYTDRLPPWEYENIFISPSKSYGAMTDNGPRLDVVSMAIENCSNSFGVNRNHEFKQRFRRLYPSFNYVVHSTFDVLYPSLNSCAANFYLLESLTCLAPFARINESIITELGQDSLEMFGIEVIKELLNSKPLYECEPNERLKYLMITAWVKLQELVSKLKTIFYEYVFYGCGHELKHHPSWCRIGSLKESVMYAVIAQLREEFGDRTVVRWMKESFKDSGWEEDYGGYAWAQCADVALSYIDNELTDLQFVDRIWTLEHNGGSFINKWHWNYGNIHKILDAHHEGRFDILYQYSSQETKGLATLIEDHIKETHVSTGPPKLVDVPKHNPISNLYEILYSRVAEKTKTLY